MQTIQLQVNDIYLNNVVNILNSLKDGIIEKFEIKKDPNLEIDPYFYERKAQLQQLLDDINSGKEPLYDFDTSMDELVLELES